MEKNVCIEIFFFNAEKLEKKSRFLFVECFCLSLIVDWILINEFWGDFEIQTLIIEGFFD